VRRYGSVIPRSGCVDIRYIAASAMKIGLSYAVTLPAYGELGSHVTLQLSGAGLTTSVFHIRKFGPHM
jgi:hypothetical protein